LSAKGFLLGGYLKIACFHWKMKFLALGYTFSEREIALASNLASFIHAGAFSY
jgi:hypothetical protein